MVLVFLSTDRFTYTENAVVYVTFCL